MKFNELEMLDFAQKIGENLQIGDVLVLTGDLGAGKTTFTKGIGKGLGVEQMIKSPTYTIVREYEGRIPLYHMDVYRVGDDPDSFDFDEYIFGQGVSVIEWGELLGDDLPDEYLEIKFTKLEMDREIEMLSHGNKYKKLIEDING
jgi:ATPase, YjeE family